MAESFRWRLSGNRDRLLEDIEEATGENTMAKALERAVLGYLRLTGNNAVVPGAGAFEELLADIGKTEGLSLLRRKNLSEHRQNLHHIEVNYGLRTGCERVDDFAGDRWRSVYYGWGA